MAKKKVVYEDDVLSRAIAEKILEKYKDKFPSIDLSKVKFVRLMSDKATKFASILETEDVAGNLFPEVWP